MSSDCLKWTTLDGTELSDFTCLEEVNVSYPSEYFKKHPGKPELTITSYSPKKLAGKIISDIKSNQRVLADHATTFVYYFFASEKAKLPQGEALASFGISIAAEGSETKIFDIYNVIFKDPDSGDALVRDPGENENDFSTFTTILKDLKACVLIILSIYRLSVITYEQFKNTTSDRLATFIKAASESSINPDPKSFLDRCGSILNSLDFKRIACAVDMFYAKFPEGGYASYRIMTVQTRYKDCAGILLFNNIIKDCEITLNELVPWLWYPSVGEDFSRLAKHHEELKHKYSYAKYMMPMKLADKCPYSSSLNKTFYGIYHSVCAGLGHERSINAVCPTDFAIQPYRNYIGLMIFVFQRAQADPKMLYMPKKDETALYDKYTKSASALKSIQLKYKADIAKRSNPYPKGKDGLEWLIWYHNNKLELTQDIKEYLGVVSSTLAKHKLREKSIGQKLQTLFEVYIVQ